MNVFDIAIEDIEIGQNRREVDQKAVNDLARSMADIGLQTPISIRIVPEMRISGEIVADVPLLVAGAHRLAAAKKLGWTHVACVEHAWNEREARLWEIAENLYRSELTALQRSEQIAEWVQLIDGLEKPSQVATVSKHVGGRGKKGGASRAAGELGLKKYDVHRALKAASLTSEAKNAAIELGLDDNHSALLRAAAVPPEAQEDEILRIAIKEKPPNDMLAEAKRLLRKYNQEEIFELIDHLGGAIER